jgi:DNA-binding transcriptional MerR regulator
MPDAKPPVYSIGAVSKMLGVAPQTIRTWQERYGVVVPERSPGGHRLYTRDHLEQLRFLSDQVTSGLSPADAHRLLRERLADGGPLPRTPEPVGSRLMILLAERDPYAADFSEYFLRTEGYDIAIVLNDIEAALTQTKDRLPDLVVVDLLIDGGQGLELCERLRDRGDVPILAISTFGQRDRAMEAGAYAFLQKPIEPLQLVSTVQDLLGRSAFIRRGRTRS